MFFVCFWESYPSDKYIWFSTTGDDNKIHLHQTKLKLKVKPYWRRPKLEDDWDHSATQHVTVLSESVLFLLVELTANLFEQLRLSSPLHAPIWFYF